MAQKVYILKNTENGRFCNGILSPVWAGWVTKEEAAVWAKSQQVHKYVQFIAKRRKDFRQGCEIVEVEIDR